MILPLPVPPASPDDAVRFIDLSGYRQLFRDIDAAFPVEVFRGARGLIEPQSRSRQAPLVVHEVGDFEASFVPSLADFSRLDRRFRLDDGVWQKMPRYADHGFAVFQLRGFASGLGRLLGRANRREFHPMAFEFPTRHPDRIFFPTAHVHDGEVHPSAEFDHSLYVQAAGAPRGCESDPGLPAGEAVWRAGGEAARTVRVGESQGVVAPRGELFKMTLQGPGVNADRWATVG